MTTPEGRHIGHLRISQELLLEWLQFQGGRILDIRRSEDFVDVFEMQVEHPDMPRVMPYMIISVLTPVYARETTSDGQTRVVRTYPVAAPPQPDA